MCVYVHPACERVCVCVFCKRFCRKRNTQRTGTQRRNTTTSIPETRLISSAFQPNQKLLRICHQCGCLCQTKRVFCCCCCLQPAVIHHIWGLLLALYSTVAGADDTRPNADFSLHPFPSAQTHNSSENTQCVCKFGHIPCSGLAFVWILADCSGTFTKADLSFQDCIYI